MSASSETQTGAGGLSCSNTMEDENTRVQVTPGGDSSKHVPLDVLVGQADVDVLPVDSPRTSLGASGGGNTPPP